MGGFSSIRGDETIVFADNASFDGTERGGKITTDGQLFIGSTAAPHIRPGTLGSSDGSITWTVGNGTITGQVTGGTTSLKTLSDDVNTTVTPAAGNIQLQGHVQNSSGKFSTVVAGTNLLKVNPMSASRWIVDSLGFNGTHTTISSAITSASSGDTIFILPGTFTENVSLKAGVNLTAYGSDSSLNQTGKVIINGTCTMTTAGTVTISGIQLQTNSANLLAVTGSAASIVNLVNCNLNCTNNTGISFTTSSSSGTININNCTGDLGTTGIALFASNSAGSLNIVNSNFSNSGGSSTANTISAGTLFIYLSLLRNPITSSSTAATNIAYTTIDSSAQNATGLTIGGSGSNAFTGTVNSGSASAISISQTLNIATAIVSSSNTNAITGAGTLTYQNISFTGSSQLINTTTQTGGLLKGGQTQAPSTGFIGERITSSVSSVALTSNTPKSITSISVTAGIWDISAIAFTLPTGGTGLAQAFVVGISTTDNAFSGTLGQDTYQFNVTASALSGVVPCVRAVLTGTTTYYLVCNSVYTSTTSPANGRISAVRVA